MPALSFLRKLKEISHDQFNLFAVVGGYRHRCPHSPALLLPCADAVGIPEHGDGLALLVAGWINRDAAACVSAANATLLVEFLNHFVTCSHRLRSHKDNHLRSKYRSLQSGLRFWPYLQL